MMRIRQRFLQLSTMLVGATFASIALAVATVDVTYTGPQSKIDETTIRLFDRDGKPVPVKPIADHRNRFSVDSGTYGAEVYVGGKQVGSRSSITVVDGGNALRVDSETGLVEVVPTAASTPVAPVPAAQPGGVALLGGGSQIRDKPPTTGVNESGTSPTSLLKGPNHVNNYTVDAEVDLKPATPDLSARFWAALFGIGGSHDGPPSTSVHVPVGTRAGWAYWMPTSTGSTGITSAGGADAVFKTRFDEVHVNGSLLHTIREEAGWSVLGQPALGYQHAEFKYEASIVNASVPGVSSSTDQKMKEDNLGIGYGVMAVYSLPNRAWAGAGAGLSAIFYHFRYDGTQDNVCVVCNPPVNPFSVSTSDSKRGVTWGASLKAIAGFPVAQDTQIIVLGTYDYHNTSAVITSKVVPTDDAPHLRTASRETAGGQVGVRVKF